jgi:hypothetical protein
MAEQQSGDDKSADFDSQGASARPGGQALGGIDPTPGDPTSRSEEEAKGDAARREMRERGFGDHKGAEY